MHDAKLTLINLLSDTHINHTSHGGGDVTFNNKFCINRNITEYVQNIVHMHNLAKKGITVPKTLADGDNIFGNKLKKNKLRWLS